MSVNPIPDGCNSVNVYLIVKDAKAAMEFYSKAFHGTASCCLEGPDGSVMHGEIQIGNSTVMLSQENPEWGTQSAETLGGSPASIHIYTDDCEALYANAIEQGCTAGQPIMEMFWGDRYGTVIDPFGFQWGIATHFEDVDSEELDRRGKEWFEQMDEHEAAQPE